MKRSVLGEVDCYVARRARKLPKNARKTRNNAMRQYDTENSEENYMDVDKTEYGVSENKKDFQIKEAEPQIWRWWDKGLVNDGTNWKFLEHKGPVFAPPYERLPSDVKFYYDGNEMQLTEETEEVATFYARLLNDECATKDVFNTNFFNDWREVMSQREQKIISDFTKCNFQHMHAYFKSKSDERKTRSKEEKQKIKNNNEELVREYGYCKIDGHREKIANFKIEPPGLFRGRGEHPMMGMLKNRVEPEDVIINCSEDSVLPVAPDGHHWKEIRHDRRVSWLASWTENIYGQAKYIILNPSSALKAQKNFRKYETARKLAKCIDQIRAQYKKDWNSSEMLIRQRATALYFLDKLSLRSGNEKNEDQADTVGCCSLRIEHISLHKVKDGQKNVVVFEFMGKDSIPYYNEVCVEKPVFDNLKLFVKYRSRKDKLFDLINSKILNKYLNELMDGLTAKVFRTYNASITLQEQLLLMTRPEQSTEEKLLVYNRANRAVAVLCNHHRVQPHSHAKSMQNLTHKIEAQRENLDKTEKQYKEVKGGSEESSSEMCRLEKRLERIRQNIQQLELQATEKEEGKEIALRTSKLNYIDQRISVAWCKKNQVAITKIFSKSQLEMFRWAIETAQPDYVF